MPLVLTGCGKDDDSPDLQTNGSANAAQDNEDNGITGPELMPDEISVDVEKLALTVGEVSGIIRFSRPLVEVPEQYLDTIAMHGFWDEEMEDIVTEEVEIKGYAKGHENIEVTIRNQHWDRIGWSYGATMIDSQTLIFQNYIPGDILSGTYTISVNILILYDTYEITNGQLHFFNNIFFPIEEIEFEYNKDLLAINCDYFEIAGELHSPFTTSLYLPGWQFEQLGSEVLNDDSFARLDLGKFTFLKSLDLSRNRISDLTLLAGLTNLESLNMDNRWRRDIEREEEVFIIDITPLAGLTNLKYLDLSGNQISDLTPLAGLKNLESLRLSAQREPNEDERGHRRGTVILSDITPLTGLTNLINLDLNENRISNITPLANLINLESLMLDSQQEPYEDEWGHQNSAVILSDIAPLAGLIKLKDLSLRENRISDITPLANLISLESLMLSGQQDFFRAERWSGSISILSDITPLAGLTNLKDLNLNSNRISDITPLAGLINLVSLELLEQQEHLDDSWDRVNILSNITPLARLISLETLNLSSNKIIDLSPLANLTSLTSLNLRSNEIFTLTPLAGLTSLTSLDLGNNSLIMDFAPLGALSNLETLNLSSSHIRDLSSLAGLTNITSLNLGWNEIFDITPLSSLTNLILLNLSNNQLIMNFAPLSELNNLETLELSNTHIANLSPLASLTTLTSLSLNSNQITDLAPLAGLTNLRYLGLRGNDGITDWSPVAHVESVWGRP